MCKVNETVLYGAAGVCKITEISIKNLNGIDTEYYVLKPVYDEKTTIFAPVCNEKVQGKIRRIMSMEEIRGLIQDMPDEDTIWIEDERSRKERYRKILAKGDRKELIKLIKTLYLRQQTKKEKGKKMHMADEQFMKEAEKILYEEFAHVLNIEREQVLPFILEQIEVEEED